MKWFSNSKSSAKLCLVFFPFFFFLFLVIFQLVQISPYLGHYFFLSQSLVKGRLDVTSQIKEVFNTPVRLGGVFDYAIFGGKYFIPMGVFPAIVGVPFLIFGLGGYSLALTVIFLILTIIFLHKLIHHFFKKDGFLISLLLVVSSPLLTTIVFQGPWYLAGLMSACLGLVFIWYFVIEKKDWAIFLIIPLVLTRPTTIFYALIPLFEAFRSRKKKTERSLFLVLTLVITLFSFFTYNYLRFGDPLEAGYRYQQVPFEEFKGFREGDSIKDYFLSNAVYMLINPLRVNLDRALRFVFPYFELSRYGIGLLFCIPWFLPYLLLNHKKRHDWLYLVTILMIMSAIFSFGGEGSFQIGSRYSCDFLPLLIFINLKWLTGNKKNIPLFYKLLNLSFILNIYYFALVMLGHMRRV